MKNTILRDSEINKKLREGRVLEIALKESTTNYFIFIYKSNGKRYHEKYDLNKKLEANYVTKEEAIKWYKEIIKNFNNTLRQGESKREYIKAYRIIITEKAIKQ